jgi:Flp pilus assembly protein TadG
MVIWLLDVLVVRMLGYLYLAISQLRTDRGGATASELALIMPLFSSLLFGTVEFGAVTYSYAAMQMAANVEARRIAVNVAAPDGASAVAEIVPIWAQSALTMSVVHSAPADPGLNTVTVQLSAPSDHMTPIALLTRLVPWTMAVNVTVKQELPYAD